MKQCIMLAAGFSSRMGVWKMMLPWKTGTVLDSALHHALEFCDRVILVTGYRGEELAQRYAGHAGIRLCPNSRFRQGMFSSVQCGASLLSGERFFVVPGDMPAIDPQVYATLWQHASDRCLHPRFEKGNGHPVLLPAALIPLILAAPQESNLREIMQARGRTSVPVTTPAIHWDLDTPQQYRALQAICP